MATIRASAMLMLRAALKFLTMRKFPLHRLGYTLRNKHLA